MPYIPPTDTELLLSRFRYVAEFLSYCASAETKADIYTRALWAEHELRDAAKLLHHVRTVRKLHDDYNAAREGAPPTMQRETER